MKESERKFLIGLEKLSRATGIVISGCGCCGSPTLFPSDDMPPEAGYAFKTGRQDVFWVSPSDKYYWGRLRDKIIKGKTSLSFSDGFNYVRKLFQKLMHREKRGAGKDTVREAFSCLVAEKGEGGSKDGTLTDQQPNQSKSSEGTRPCSPYPTSDKLEAIVSKFRLNICEVVRGCGEDDSPIFRFDFVATSDNEDPMICGSSCCVFPSGGTPRDFAMTLRIVADRLDQYWAEAFPGALQMRTRGADDRT